MAGQLSPLNESRIAGPFTLFDGSFILEFLQPDKSRDATVLMRATYKHDHLLVQKSKSHPQSPPLHLHFNQSETFEVLSGKVGTTTGYNVIDKVWTAADPAHKIEPWIPHTFWPVPGVGEDTTMLVWAHPQDVEEPMDWLFFQNLLMYVSDIHEKKVSMDPFQIMLTQHVSATALVWFPTWTFLGPLRWWVPWKVQGGFAAVARLIGRTPLMEKYTPGAYWNSLERLKQD